MAEVVSVYSLAINPKHSVILDIQGVKFQGSGKINITGNVSPLTYESLDIVKSLIKLQYDYPNIYDFHIHFSCAFVKKDGSSWGAACLLLMLYLCEIVPYKTSIALTGEIDLKGNILPVGHLQEKIDLWSQQDEIKYLIIPSSSIEINHSNIIKVENMNKLIKLLKNDIA